MKLLSLTGLAGLSLLLMGGAGMAQPAPAPLVQCGPQLPPPYPCMRYRNPFGSGTRKDDAESFGPPYYVLGDLGRRPRRGAERFGRVVPPQSGRRH
jgi:hypothetical protein